jgi:hypothetical protein
MNIHRSWPAGVVVLVVTVVLAACGGSTTGTAGDDSGGSAAAGGQVAPASASSGSSAETIDVCAAVSATDVGAFMTKPMKAGLPPVNPQQPGFSTCEYTASDATAPAVNISAIVTGDPSAAAMVYSGYEPVQGQPAAIALTGIGDKAMHAPGTLDMWSVKGPILCNISIDDPASAIVADYRGLATPGADAQDNYPDDSMAAYDQQIGVLCNKVFAAGGQ